jgi:hypothetical protein
MLIVVVSAAFSCTILQFDLMYKFKMLAVSSHESSMVKASIDKVVFSVVKALDHQSAFGIDRIGICVLGFYPILKIT